MRQYSSDLVQVSWSGLDLAPGLAQGTFIQPRRAGVTWVYKPDGMGGVIPMYFPDRSGTLTLLIDAESKQHQQLITLANVDLLTRAIAAPMVITDLNNKEVSIYTRAKIQTHPDIPKAVRASIVPWVFIYEITIQQPFSFNENVVGA